MNEDVSPGQVPAIELLNVVKCFGSFTAIRNASLSISDNEFFTLLGPSGCGKTTLLRLIAGFEAATDGEIRLFGKNLSSLPPNRRPVNTVFQNYALFPHMTVAENIGFGLRMKGVSEDKVRTRIARMLALVRLEQFADRKPSQLSGGQQQRAALVRAIAPDPKVLLLDEPLSALDLKLRQAMRVELKQLQKETGITFIFVTHDQEEALVMSDRIAVMSEGEIQQIGTARTIYERPFNQTVAKFIGETNLFDVKIGKIERGEFVASLTGGLELLCKGDDITDEGIGSVVLIRPEKIILNPDRDDINVLAVTIESSHYLGTDNIYQVRLENGLEMSVRRQNVQGDGGLLDTGAHATIGIDPGSIQLLHA